MTGVFNKRSKHQIEGIVDYCCESEVIRKSNGSLTLNPVEIELLLESNDTCGNMLDALIVAN